MKKKLIAGLLTAGLAVSLAACGGGSSAASSAAEAASSAAAAASSAVEEAAEAASSAAEEAVVEAKDVEEEVMEEEVKTGTDTVEGTAPSQDVTVDTTKYKKEMPADGWKIGYADFQMFNTWKIQTKSELESACERAEELYGCKITLVETDAGGDIAKQNSDVQDLIAQGVDAIISMPANDTGVNEAYKQAVDKGIPVCLFEVYSSDPSCYTNFTSSDQFTFGYNLGKDLMSKVDDGAKIVMFSGSAGATSSELRDEGFFAAVEESGKNIEILNQYYTDWAYDKGKQYGEEMCAAYPEIDGIYSQGGACSMGIIEAMEAAGRELVPITGEDNNGLLKMWKERQADGFSMVCCSDPSYQSVIALEQALKALNGEPLQQANIIDSPVITDENLDDYVRPEYSDSYWCMTSMTKEQADALYLE